MDSDDIFEGDKSCPEVNDKDPRSECSILPLRNRIGLRRLSSVSRFHFERQGRLRPISVEEHRRQYKGMSGEAKSPGELDADHS